MNPIINNWTYGEISPKFGGRFDLDVYQQGCSLLSNFRPMKQGGITRRPPLKHLGVSVKSRIIPFTLSGGESYILEFSDNRLSFWAEDDGVFSKMQFTEGFETKDYIESPYKDSAIWEFQYAQYYDRMYFAHRGSMQRCLYFYAGGGTPYFSFEAFVITTEDDENMGKLGKTQHYPGVVAICQNRLWFASTTANPYTMWASRPYEDVGSHADFTTKDLATAEVEVLKAPEEWPKTTDPFGNEVYDLSDSSKLIEVINEEEEVITARCAMELELASGRNDKISWIAPLNNIIVGTEASEWELPSNIDPTRQAASMQSAYGSAYIQPVVLNNGLFYIQNGMRLREFTMTQEGGVSVDHSFTADHMLDGVKQIATMRTPDPMVLLLMNDGTLAIFVYDRMYGIQAWARWETDGDIISIAVKETPKQQDKLVAIVKRGEVFYLEYFDFEESANFIDRYEAVEDGVPPSINSNLEYESKMVGNRLDFIGEGGVSIGRSKKVKDVWIRCIGSGKVKTGVDDKYIETSTSELGDSDYCILTSGGSRKELNIIVKAVEADPLTVLAITYNVEVN